VTVPVRFPIRLTAMESVTIPLPVPFAPLVTVIQFIPGPGAAVHAQPAFVVTVTDLLPPKAGTLLIVVGFT
jgi:hypothetical protein